MHDTYLDSIDLKVEHQYALHHHGHDFRQDQMVDIASHHSLYTSPLHGPFDFDPPTDTMDSHTVHPSYLVPQSLHPVNTTTLWPSQITNPSQITDLPHIASPIHRSITPVTQSAPAPVALSPSAQKPTPTPSKPTQTVPTARRTLSDDDRRRMCKYNEENPTVKQTEIGAMFGVERSTVSKVLRQKEKYLVPEDGRRSPVKRSKSKFPGLERTLSKWVKNRISENLPVDDNIIRDEARKFASTLASAESYNQVNDPSWLESFKQKNQFSSADSSAVQTERNSLSPSSKSGSKTPSGVSPTIGWDSTPINPVKDKFKTKSPDGFYDTTTAWGQTHSQSSASLGSCFSDNKIASLSHTGDFRSPTSPPFPPLSSCGPSPAMPAQKKARIPLRKIAPAPAALRRRQTVPLIGAESPDSATSKRHPSASLESFPGASTQPCKSPALGPPFTNNHSALSMAPPTNGIDGSTSLPSQDEARAALETLMTFIHHQPNGVVDPHDYAQRDAPHPHM